MDALLVLAHLIVSIHEGRGWNEYNDTLSRSHPHFTDEESDGFHGETKVTCLNGTVKWKNWTWKPSL